MFEDPLQNEIFKERCHDTGDSTTSKYLSFVFLTKYHILVENAKIFKEEFLKRNVKTQQGILNLQSMRLGINSVIALSNKIGHGGKKVSLSRVS